jgi:hypothetical protein
MSNHHGAPLIRRKPGPQPAAPNRDEIFLKVFAAALTGICSQFETTPFVNRKPSFCEGEAELSRCRVLTRRAWNVAAYSCQLFEERNTVSAFNEEVRQ